MREAMRMPLSLQFSKKKVKTVQILKSRSIDINI